MTSCTVCDSKTTRSVVSIGDIPVYCNVLWATRQEAVQAPVGDIDLFFCTTCGHLFNGSFETAKTDYTRDYENSLHFSPRFNRYAEDLVDRLIEVYAVGRKTIVEIGCGKGDFLAMLCSKGQNRGYGFDRSYDPDRGGIDPTLDITFIRDFYGPGYTDLPVDLVCCRHVLEHLERPTDFLRQLRAWIGDRPEVVVYFEVPNALFTVRDLGIWDLIYEHCSYFTEPSLVRAFTLAGFEVCSSRTAFGQQYLQIEVRPSKTAGVASPKAISFAETLMPDVEAFNRRYCEKIDWWNAELGKQQSPRAVVWGGGSKGVTFLNVLRAASGIDFLVDVNPHKQGKFVPRTGQRVIGPVELVDDAPDRVIVMNEVYKEEISLILNELDIDPELVVA